jgi:hypothetical protein
MRIVLISQMTPASDNIRGTSALPYHLMVNRDADIEIIIYSFNGNNLSSEQIEETEKELNVKIKTISQPSWLKWILKFHLLFIRALLSYPIFNYMKLSIKTVDEIKSLNPDGIWFYGQDISRVVKQFPGYKRVHTLPDCESLYYYRMLGQRFVFKSRMMFWRNMMMYPKYLRMESSYENDDTVNYDLVGNEDAKSLRNINPGIKANFILHPHYNVLEPRKEIAFSAPKIKLLIAGQYNLYMIQCADELIAEMCKNSDLANNYVVTFLGKGWEQHVVDLRNAGYEVNHVKFAPTYMEEVCQHDIQITPITIGTGTKGKVLDAIANGLMVIGTPYAMENIAVESGKSCMEYETAEQAITILRDIPENVSKYESIAEAGREAVLKYHDRATVSKQLFELFK